MYQSIINDHTELFEKAVEHFKDELNQLRTGRASAALVEDLSVDYYGTKTPIKQMASITTPEARTIAISPWDKSALGLIEKSIRDSQMNLNPNNDGQIIRINLPALTEDRRKELVKVLGKKAEEAKISVRKIRESAWEKIQSAEKEGQMSEDDKFSGKEKLQETVDQYNGQIEELRERKEKDILTI